MQITLNQEEINAAVDAYVRHRMNIGGDQQISGIDFTAGRGGNGLSATLDITAKVVGMAAKVSQANTVPIQGITTSPTAVDQTTMKRPFSTLMQTRGAGSNQPEAHAEIKQGGGLIPTQDFPKAHDEEIPDPDLEEQEKEDSPVEEIPLAVQKDTTPIIETTIAPPVTGGRTPPKSIFSKAN